MNFKRETIGSVVESITNGVNCKQNKEGFGVKISRIETIAHRKIDYQKTGFCKLNEIDKKKYKLIKGDILFSHINSPIHVGKTALYDGKEDLYHGVNLLKIKVKKHINPYYFKYFLDEIFQSGYWKGTSKQSVNQASVNQTDIKKIDFFYPSLAEQQRIVVKLDAAFLGIDKAIKATEKAIEIAEISFSNTIDAKTTFKKNWKKYKISNLGLVQTGNTPKTSNKENYGDNIPFVKPPHFRTNGTIDVDKNTLSKEGAKFSRKASANSVMMVCIGATIGKVAMNPKDVCFNQQIIFLLQSRNMMLSLYIGK
jgi:type I restriction enzyme, S subunit